MTTVSQMIRRLWQQRRQIFTFLCVGGASSLIDFGVFYLLSTFLHVIPWVASAISFLCAFAVNYRGNRDLVFKAGKVSGALPRYIVLVGFNWVVSTGVVAGLTAAKLPDWGAKIISMALVVVINFFALKFIVFRSSSRSKNQEPEPGKDLEIVGQDADADSGEPDSETQEQTS